MTHPRSSPESSPEPSVTELAALAKQASARAALYRRRVFLGRGEPSRLAELERISKGAADRWSRARARARLEA
jgi:hypothetical protein